jgi:hypothetical protein
MSKLKPQTIAPLTATALIAQQMGANAMRDGLFLSFFPVETLPYFMARAAVLAIPAALLSGRVLARLGPIRVAPAIFGLSAALFLAEWGLLGWLPRAAAEVRAELIRAGATMTVSLDELRHQLNAADRDES